MGLLFVLILLAILSVVLGTFMAGAFAAISAFLTRGVTRDSRKKLIVAAAFLPFVCLAWAGVVFAFQAAVNTELLHRDIGLGDGLGDEWYAPLPNGHQVSLIDFTDQGSICPIAQGDGCTSLSVSGVRSLQVSGYYLLGAIDRQPFEHLGQQTAPVDQWFVLDAQDRKMKAFTSFDQLRAESSKLGISLHLEPIYSGYSHYRFSWFDIFGGCLLVLPTIGALALLAYRIVRLRRTRTTLASA